MLPKPGFLGDVKYPRIAWFTLEGVALGVIGVLMWLVGQVASPTVASLGEIAFIVGLMTAVFGSLGYLIVSFTAHD